MAYMNKHNYLQYSSKYKYLAKMTHMSLGATYVFLQ